LSIENATTTSTKTADDDDDNDMYAWIGTCNIDFLLCTNSKLNNFQTGQHNKHEKNCIQRKQEETVKLICVKLSNHENHHWRSQT
jgi:hypothetical protein